MHRSGKRSEKSSGHFYNCCTKCLKRWRRCALASDSRELMQMHRRIVCKDKLLRQSVQVLRNLVDKSSPDKLLQAHNLYQLGRTLFNHCLRGSSLMDTKDMEEAIGCLLATVEALPEQHCKQHCKRARWLETRGLALRGQYILNIFIQMPPKKFL